MSEIWTFSLAECLDCGHVWIGVHPVGAAELECPECGGSDTVRENTVEEE